MKNVFLIALFSIFLTPFFAQADGGKPHWNGYRKAYNCIGDKGIWLPCNFCRISSKGGAKFDCTLTPSTPATKLKVEPLRVTPVLLDAGLIKSAN
jgi:hypothetical protein